MEGEVERRIILLRFTLGAQEVLGGVPIPPGFYALLT
jgi:hypothetical protein